MEIAYHRRKTCRLCLSGQVLLGSQFVSTPPGDLYLKEKAVQSDEKVFPLDLFLCASCGNIQLLDVVSPEVIYENYVYRTGISVGLPKYFKEYADDVLAFIDPRPGSLVIDIGSNDGTLLRYFKECGFEILGIDPSPIAQIANQSGVETFHGFFSTALARQIRLERGIPQVVTANNVVANIDDLDDFFMGIRELIGIEGCFVFETGYGLDLVEKKLLDVVHHEHLSYFTVTSLQRSLHRFGLELIHVEHTASKGGCIRSYIQGKNGTRKIQPSVAQMMDIEKSRKIDQIEVFEGFNQFIKKTRERLHAQIAEAQGRQETIAGYGASIGTTTLEYLFGLSDKVAFLADDNPDRFGMYSPGHHLPVHDSKILEERKPALVIVFAWRYIDSILKKHQTYMQNGGKFLVFLPEWKIYSR